MGCLLQFLLFILFLGLFGALRFWIAIRSVLNASRKQAEQFEQRQSQGTQSQSSSTTQGNTHGAAPRKKVFADNEGEYVEFEEIKES